MQHVLEQPGDGTKLTVAVGDAVVLRLDQQSSGGYLWAVSEVPGFLDASTDEVAPLEGALPGSVHTRVLGLRASRPGVGEVVLTLKRPWEAEPVRQLRIEITAADREPA